MATKDLFKVRGTVNQQETTQNGVQRRQLVSEAKTHFESLSEQSKYNLYQGNTPYSYFPSYHIYGI